MQSPTWWKLLVEGPFVVRQRRLRAERESFTEADFVRAFEPHGELAGELWNALRREAAVDDFRPAPDDDLIRVFGLADEDLDDVVLALLKRCGCRIPEPAETATMPPVRTVGDVVSFLAAMKRSRGPGERTAS